MHGEHAFSAFLTSCYSHSCLYSSIGTGQHLNRIRKCFVCAQKQTQRETRARIRNLNIYLSFSNKQVPKILLRTLFHFSAKSDTFCQYKKQILVTYTHTTYLWTLPRCHTALLHACYQVRSQKRELPFDRAMAGIWQASLWGIYML